MMLYVLVGYDYQLTNYKSLQKNKYTDLYAISKSNSGEYNMGHQITYLNTRKEFLKSAHDWLVLNFPDLICSECNIPDM